MPGNVESVEILNIVKLNSEYEASFERKSWINIWIKCFKTLLVVVVVVEVVGGLAAIKTI